MKRYKYAPNYETNASTYLNYITMSYIITMRKYQLEKEGSNVTFSFPCKYTSLPFVSRYAEKESKPASSFRPAYKLINSFFLLFHSKMPSLGLQRTADKLIIRFLNSQAKEHLCTVSVSDIM